MESKFKGIKKITEYRRGELTKDLLRLIGAGVLIGAAVAAPNTIQLVDYFDPKGRTQRKRIWDAIKYLEMKNRIRIDDSGTHPTVYLTSHGQLVLSEETVWEITIPKPRRWDRKWRLVMFDFPTKHERVRHAFRIKLEDLGFILYQRSVFIYPYECNEEIHTVAQWFGVDEYVRYIVATEVHDMKKFAREFDLL